jgi:hypothetical protein
MSALKTIIVDAIKHSRRVRFWGAILAAVIVTYVFEIEGSGAIIIILGTFLLAKWRA